MPTDQDRKRLVRQRMVETGERYTTALAAIRATPSVDELYRSLDVPDRRDQAWAQLEALTDGDRRSAALRGIESPSWRARRRACQLLDDLNFDDVTLAALDRALADEHAKVRRAALHTRTCIHCKPDGCVPDLPAVLTRMLGDPSRQVRGVVVGLLSWWGREPWAVALLERSTDDPSAELRALATQGLARLAHEADGRERFAALSPDAQQRSVRHAGKWVAIDEDRVVAVATSARIARRDSRRHPDATIALVP
jgi:hypothetical protein